MIYINTWFLTASVLLNVFAFPIGFAMGASALRRKSDGDFCAVCGGSLAESYVIEAFWATAPGRNESAIIHERCFDEETMDLA